MVGTQKIVIPYYLDTIYEFDSVSYEWIIRSKPLFKLQAGFTFNTSFLSMLRP